MMMCVEEGRENIIEKERENIIEKERENIIEKERENIIEKEEKEEKVESFETADEATLSQVAFLDRLDQVSSTQQDMRCTPAEHSKVILMDHVTEHQVNLFYKWKPLSISIMA